MVKVDKFTLHVDLAIFKMEDCEISIILGRPFLATRKALIDAQDVKFKIEQNAKLPKDIQYCKRIKIIDSYVETTLIFSDLLEP